MAHAHCLVACQWHIWFDGRRRFALPLSHQWFQWTVELLSFQSLCPSNGGQMQDGILTEFWAVLFSFPFGVCRIRKSWIILQHEIWINFWHVPILITFGRLKISSKLMESADDHSSRHGGAWVLSGTTDSLLLKSSWAVQYMGTVMLDFESADLIGPEFLRIWTFLCMHIFVGQCFGYTTLTTSY